MSFCFYISYCITWFPSCLTAGTILFVIYGNAISLPCFCFGGDSASITLALVPAGHFFNVQMTVRLKQKTKLPVYWRDISGLTS